MDLAEGQSSGESLWLRQLLYAFAPKTCSFLERIATAIFSTRRACSGCPVAGGRWRIVAVSFAIKGQSRVCLESLSKKFENDITAERGDRGNFKIGSGEDIFQCPNYASFLSQT